MSLGAGSGLKGASPVCIGDVSNRLVDEMASANDTVAVDRYRGVSCFAGVTSGRMAFRVEREQRVDSF
jgi:hypothetical protein